MSSKVYDPTTTPPPAAGGAYRPAATGGPSPIPPTTAPPPHAAADEQAQRDQGPNPAVEALHRLGRDVEELKEYASLYAAAKVDGVKRTVRNIGLYAALGVLGLIAGGALVATAVGLIVVGLAVLLGNAFGGRYWLGNMVTGVLVLAVIGAGVWFMMNKLTGTWRSQTMKKYEQRKQSQRQRFGHDVSQRAAQAPAAQRPGHGRAS
jgi:uncharacterized membrane protein YqjE